MKFDSMVSTSQTQEEEEGPRLRDGPLLLCHGKRSCWKTAVKTTTALIWIWTTTGTVSVTAALPATFVAQVAQHWKTQGPDWEWSPTTTTTRSLRRSKNQGRRLRFSSTKPSSLSSRRRKQKADVSNLSPPSQPDADLCSSSSGSETLESPGRFVSTRYDSLEDLQLLQQVKEYRRLQDLEMQPPPEGISTELWKLTSVRCKAAGYGEDLQAYEEALEEGPKARNELVTRHMGLVRFVVQDIGKRRFKDRGWDTTRRSSRNTLTPDDLEQEGVLGLARAVDKYRMDLDTKFSTYAVYWIRAAVLRCLAERQDLIRIPENVAGTFRQLWTSATTTPTPNSKAWQEALEAKALALGLTDQQARTVVKVHTRQRVPLEARSTQRRLQKLDAANSSSSSSSLEREERREQVRQVVAPFLRPKEMEALSWRYGLLTPPSPPKPAFRNYLAEADEDLFGPQGILTKAAAQRHAKYVEFLPQEENSPVNAGRWGEAMSFAEVGRQMAISAEYGRRLCAAALRKLQEAADDGRLRPEVLSF